MKKECDNVIINCTENIDENIFHIFCRNFENEFQEINAFFAIQYEKLYLNLVTKDNLDDIVKKESSQYKDTTIPNWLVGFATFKEAFVLYPTAESLDELYKVALHEITHLISYKLNTDQKRLKILDEGIAVFLSKQYEGKRFTPWVNAYLRNKLPLISNFCTFDPMEFASQNGY